MTIGRKIASIALAGGILAGGAVVAAGPAQAAAPAACSAATFNLFTSATGYCYAGAGADYPDLGGVNSFGCSSK
ncbi:hypothetical protein [Streptacidiphilus albus]|uniref:hypothetical protein n=1 Tax=Streptacidiphilus albus TaxID=105425 RepID=UPI00054B0252|nr:hypothetical protein [Streptacidiphilus albus]